MSCTLLPDICGTCCYRFSEHHSRFCRFCKCAVTECGEGRAEGQNFCDAHTLWFFRYPHRRQEWMNIERPPYLLPGESMQSWWQSQISCPLPLNEHQTYEHGGEWMESHILALPESSSATELESGSVPRLEVEENTCSTMLNQESIWLTNNLDARDAITYLSGMNINYDDQIVESDAIFGHHEPFYGNTEAGDASDESRNYGGWRSEVKVVQRNVDIETQSQLDVTESFCDSEHNEDELFSYETLYEMAQRNEAGYRGLSDNLYSRYD